MKLLFSIILNGFILFLIVFLLGANESKGLSAGVSLACGDCIIYSLDAIKTYFLGGVILGTINLLVKPILKILTLPLFFLFFGFSIFIVNAIVLQLFGYIINEILLIPGISYTIVGWGNFVIAVAIFTILNMFYSLLFFKK